jgi:hypothetical protein
VARRQRPAAPGGPAATCRSAEPGSQDSRPARSGSMARMSSRSARLPAALAASRQRSSAEDRSPGAAVTGCRPGRPRAARFPASGRRGPRRRARTRQRRVQPAPAGHLGVCRTPWCQAVTLVISVPAQCRVPHERVVPRRGAVMLVMAAITPAALTAGQVRRPRDVVSRPGREGRRLPAIMRPRPPRRAGNCHGPRGRTGVMIGSPAR